MPPKGPCKNLEENVCLQNPACKWSEKYKFCYPESYTQKQMSKAGWNHNSRKNPSYRQKENQQNRDRYHEKILGMSSIPKSDQFQSIDSDSDTTIPIFQPDIPTEEEKVGDILMNLDKNFEESVGAETLANFPYLIYQDRAPHILMDLNINPINSVSQWDYVDPISVDNNDYEFLDSNTNFLNQHNAILESLITNNILNQKDIDYIEDLKKNSGLKWSEPRNKKKRSKKISTKKILKKRYL